MTDHSDEAVMAVSLLLASLATIVNVAIEVQPAISSPTATLAKFISTPLMMIIIMMMITIMMMMARKNTDGGKDDDGGEPHWAWFHISLSWCQVPTLIFFN